MTTDTTHRTSRLRSWLIAALLALTVAIALLGAASLRTGQGPSGRPVTAGRTLPVVAAQDWRHRTLVRHHLAAAPRTLAEGPSPAPLLSSDFASSSCA